MHASNTLTRPRAFDDDHTAYKAGMFFRATMLGDDVAKDWCAGRVTIEKAAGESTGPNGGYVVPVEVERAVIKLRTLAGTFRRNARVRLMGSDSKSFPRREGGMTVTFVGENAQISESDRTWSSVNLNAKKIAALGRMSTELTEDETVDLANETTEEIAYGFAALEDSCGWNGDGTGAFGGISGVCTKIIDGTHTASAITAATNNDTFDELTAADLGTLIGACPEYALAGAKWYASSYAIGRTFARLGATAAGMTMTSTGPRPLMQYLSWPIEPVPSLPGSGDQSGKPMIFFGDLSMAATLGDRRGVTIKTTESRYLEYDQIGIRGTERFDINVHDLGNTTTAGPLVALVGN
jgi:HK97 family phage major capsid protein